MVSRVTYRPFDEDDFNEIAAILQDAWHSGAPSPGYAFLEACCDLSHSLSISTFSQVALIDGSPRGIVLARSNSLRVPVSGRWRRSEEDFLEQMEASDPHACAAWGHFVAAQDHAYEGLLDKAKVPSANEITLLAVSSAARGLGIGGVLLDAASSYLASHGAARAFVYTDTDCDWPFYEKHGLKRAAAHRATRDERKILPKELYLYTLNLHG